LRLYLYWEDSRDLAVTGGGSDANSTHQIPLRTLSDPSEIAMITFEGFRQFDPRQTRRDAGGDRARVVPVALLRDTLPFHPYYTVKDMYALTTAGERSACRRARSGAEVRPSTCKDRNGLLRPLRLLRPLSRAAKRPCVDRGTRSSVPHSFKFFQLAVRQPGRARRSAGTGACTGAGAACPDSAGAHGPLRRRRADRAVVVRRRPARIRLILITNHIATHVPALVGSRASRPRACSCSLRIGDPGDCHERGASNRSKTDFVHGVSSR
jgi:hypothetical protein